jgi:hypothetical protein
LLAFMELSVGPVGGPILGGEDTALGVSLAGEERAVLEEEAM